MVGEYIWRQASFPGILGKVGFHNTRICVLTTLVLSHRCQMRLSKKPKTMIFGLLTDCFYYTEFRQKATIGLFSTVSTEIFRASFWFPNGAGCAIYTAFGYEISGGNGKRSQVLDWEHKAVFGGFFNGAIMSGKTGCSLCRINDDEDSFLKATIDGLAF